MRVKVVSDGTTAGTHVVNAETGEEINGVMSIRWEARPDRADAFCHIEVMAHVEVEAEAEVERMHPMPWFPKETAHAGG